MPLEPGDVVLCRGFGKPRPVVVVSRAELNRGRYAVVIPLTTRRRGEREPLANCWPLTRGEAGLDRDCVAQADAIAMMAVDQLDGGHLGSLGETAMAGLTAAIGYVIGAKCERF